MSLYCSKKRSLHEGGIRQTIVVQWPGTIAANSISDDMFIFYDFLPTAAELAGVPRSSWCVQSPETDHTMLVVIARTLIRMWCLRARPPN